MFTGLIETVGLSSKATARGNYVILSVTSKLPVDEITIGESIACNGVCLTVVEKGSNEFAVELSQETVARVDMSRFQVGRKINLERALRMGDRLGGHWVSGHVDTTGNVDYLKSVGESLELAIKFDPEFDLLVIDKGSIAIDGVSLTINRIKSGWLAVNLIPHTGRETNLSELKAGVAVNLEFDLIGKYIMRSQQLGATKGLTVETLLESGW
ncbi:MAG: riboflavin synthase [candidate division Zixibacteria bacterium]|nr:riboflavin synthase [candidate division Zixibacteria bacterium]